MPVRPSPAVLRAGQMLRVVAEDPGRQWTLTELSRAVGSYPSTCHTVVLALTESGLLRRHSERSTFGLGPALVALGERARQGISLVDLAEPELVALRDRHQATAMLATVSGSSIIATSLHPAHQPLGYGVVPNMAVPFRAPIGSIYVAWSPPDEIDAWLQRGQPEVTTSRARELRRDLAVVRSRGWSATVRRRAGNETAAYRELRDFSDADDLPLIGVSSPVLGAAGEVACSLALSTFPEPVGGRALRAMVEDLKTAAAHIQAVGREAPARHHRDLAGPSN